MHMTNIPVSNPAPHPISAPDLLAMNIPPRRMLLDPWLPEGGLAMLYAPRGIGKTWAALALANAVASGGSVLNSTAAEPVPVLYVDGEMVLADLQTRLAHIIHPQPAPPMLHFLAANALPTGLPDIADKAGTALLNTDASEVGAKLIVLDNLSSLARYKENESDSWQPIQDLILSFRRRGIAVLMIHHSGKGGQQRGTSRREDALDTVIALRRSPEADPTSGARFEWNFEKSRGFSGPAAAPFDATLSIDATGAATWTTTPLDPSPKDTAIDMLKNGAPVREVADALGVPLPTLYRWRDAEGLNTRRKEASR